jgi:hypothetical protein
MPKVLTAGVAFAVFAGLACGQDRLARDEAERYAKLCVESFGSPGGDPIATKVDPSRAVAVRGEGGGAMVIPQTGLTAEMVTRAGKDVVPIGQLWLRKWVPVIGNKPAPADKLRVVAVNADGKDRPMPVLLLGVRKGVAGLELVGYAKDADPLFVLPLKPVGFVQDVPLDLTWERGEKTVDPLTVTVFGKYRAVVPVTR